MRAIFSALDDPRWLLALAFHHGAQLSLFADRFRSDLLLERTAMRPHGGIRVREAEGNEYVRRLEECTERAATTDTTDQTKRVGLFRLFRRFRP